MNFNKLLKIAAIGGASYAMACMGYLCGKGNMIRIMKEYNLTADDVLNMVKEGVKDGPLGMKINFMIIDAVATPVK